MPESLLHGLRVGGLRLRGLRVATSGGAGVPSPAYAMAGPATGSSGVASAPFSVLLGSGAPAGTTTITPSDGGQGGTFSPTSLALTNAAPSGTFTYTPASAGTVPISIGNDAGLVNPPAAMFTGANGGGLSVAISAPATGATVAGQVTVSATVAGGTPGRVDLLVDGVPQGVGLTASPYTWTLDSTRWANGTHSLVVRAWSGTTSATGAYPNHDDATALVTIANATGAGSAVPTITSPAAGATVWGTIAVAVTTTGTAYKVDFLVDGTLWWSDPTSPYTGLINTDLWVDGGHTITARAWDASGNHSDATVSLTFSNSSIPSGAVAIPAGTATIAMNTANTYYYLTGDVTALGMGANVTADGCTLDLNGHTLTYDNDTPIVVANNGFETNGGSGSSTAANWDASGAPTFTIQPARVGMYDSWMAQVGPTTATESILSDPITLPASGIPYAYGVQCTATNSPNVTIAVVDATTTTTVYSTYTQNSGTVGNGGIVSNDQSSSTAWTPAAGQTSVRIKITVAPSTSSGSNPVTAYLDYVWLDRYGNNSSGVPVIAGVALTAFNRNSLRVIDSAGGGKIVQGQARSCWAHMIATDRCGCSNLEVRNIGGSFWGADCCGVLTGVIGACVVEGCTLTANVDRQVNRQNWRGFIIPTAATAGTAAGVHRYTGNDLSGGTQNGIAVQGQNTLELTIANNTIRQDSRWGDGYCVTLYGVANPVVHGNTGTPTSGRGLLLQTDHLKGSIYGGDIHDNSFSIQEKGNLENGQSQTAIALRIRTYDTTGLFNTRIYNNTFVATTGSVGYSQWCAGSRVNIGAGHATDGAGTVLDGNTFRGILSAIDPALGSQDSFGFNLATVNATVGPGMIFVGNTLDSDDCSLALNTSDGIAVYDGWFVGNTLSQSASGLQSFASNYTATTRGYLPFLSNYQGGFCQDIRLIDQQYAGGAAFGLTLGGGSTKQISTGFLLDLTVRTAGGSPVSGAAVVVKDTAGAVAWSGTTNGAGKVTLNPFTGSTGIPLGSTTYTSDGTSGQNATPAQASNNPFTVAATSGALSGSTSVTLSADQALALTVA